MLLSRNRDPFEGGRALSSEECSVCLFVCKRPRSYNNQAKIRFSTLLFSKAGFLSFFFLKVFDILNLPQRKIFLLEPALLNILFRKFYYPRGPPRKFFFDGQHNLN